MKIVLSESTSIQGQDLLGHDGEGFVFFNKGQDFRTTNEYVSFWALRFCFLHSEGHGLNHILLPRPNYRSCKTSPAFGNSYVVRFCLI